MVIEESYGIDGPFSSLIYCVKTGLLSDFQWPYQRGTDAWFMSPITQRMKKQRRNITPRAIRKNKPENQKQKTMNTQKRNKNKPQNSGNSSLFLFLFFFSGDSSRQFVFFWWYVFDSVCFLFCIFLLNECSSWPQNAWAQMGI